MLPLLEIPVDTNGTALRVTEPVPTFWHPEGHFLLAEDHRIWHWDLRGRLLHTISFAEPERIGNLFWNKKFYWVFFPSGGEKGSFSRVLDGDGKHSFRTDHYYPQFAHVDFATNTLIAVDISRVKPRSLQAPLLQELNLHIDWSASSLEVNQLGPPFFKLTPMQMGWRGNFKDFFIVRDVDQLHIIDQLTPTIWHHPLTAGSREDDFTEKDQTSLQLSHFLMPPAKLHQSDDMRRDLKTWSRFNFFSNHPKGFLVGYSIPDANDPYGSHTALDVVTRAGKLRGKPVVIAGTPLAFQNGRIYSFHFKKDDGSQLVLQIHEL